MATTELTYNSSNRYAPTAAIVGQGVMARFSNVCAVASTLAVALPVMAAASPYGNDPHLFAVFADRPPTEKCLFTIRNQQYKSFGSITRKYDSVAIDGNKINQVISLDVNTLKLLFILPDLVKQSIDANSKLILSSLNRDEVDAPILSVSISTDLSWDDYFSKESALFDLIDSQKLSEGLRSVIIQNG